MLIPLSIPEPIELRGRIYSYALNLSNIDNFDER